MPQRDGTGPQGKGPKTGRGTGSCTSATASQKDVNAKDVSAQDANVSGDTQSPMSNRPHRSGGGRGRNAV